MQGNIYAATKEFDHFQVKISLVVPVLWIRILLGSAICIDFGQQHMVQVDKIMAYAKKSEEMYY